MRIPFFTFWRENKEMQYSHYCMVIVLLTQILKELKGRKKKNGK